MIATTDNESIMDPTMTLNTRFAARSLNFAREYPARIDTRMVKNIPPAVSQNAVEHIAAKRHLCICINLEHINKVLKGWIFYKIGGGIFINSLIGLNAVEKVID